MLNVGCLGFPHVVNLFLLREFKIHYRSWHEKSWNKNNKHRTGLSFVTNFLKLKYSKMDILTCQHTSTEPHEAASMSSVQTVRLLKLFCKAARHDCMSFLIKNGMESFGLVSLLPLCILLTDIMTVIDIDWFQSC
jgi:hypothetical protein